MSAAVISLEAFCILLLLTIIYGSIFEIKRKSRKNSTFIASVVTLIVATSADMIAWIFNGKAELSSLLWISNFLSFTIGYFMSVMIMQYITLHISEKVTVPGTYNIIMASACGIAELAAIIFSLNKGYFSIENGCYLVGDYYSVSQIFSFFSLFFIAFIILRYAKVCGRHDTVAMLSYITLPIISVLLHFVFPQLSLSFVASAFSTFLVYVMLQAEQEREFRNREAELYEESNTDILTGLLNRRAYDTMCKVVMGSNNIGVIFCDLNSLKYTNDNFGHEAGDKLLQEFAEILINNFRKEEIYRISGDEFVVLLPSIPKDIFEKREQLFIDAVKNRKYPIASVGSTYGKGDMLFSLITEAENNMYSDKQLFHKEYPQYSRKNS